MSRPEHRSNPRHALAPAQVLLLGLGLVLSSGAFAQDESQPSFADAVAVTVVEVPVQVIDGGRAVGGLSAENFEIYDEGKRQQILSVEVIDFSSQVGAATRGSEAVGELTPSAMQRRNLLLLFDFTFSSPGLLARAREGALEMVRNQLGPRDRAAVAVYGSGGGARMLTGFTTDRKALELALDVVGAALDRKGKKEKEAWNALLTHLHGDAEHRPPPLKTLASTLGSQGALALAGPLLSPDVSESSLVVGLGEEAGGAGAGSQANEDGFQREGALATVVASDPSEMAQASLAQVELAGVRSLTEGLGELVTVLAPVAGQNHLLFFSQGFSARYLTGDTSVQSATDSLEEMYAAFRRAGWSIHAVDVSGLRASAGGDIGSPVGNPGAPGGQPASGFMADTLLVMADSTGGELYENFNRMEQATAQVLERTRVTYLLTFSPQAVVADGSYRKLDVKLKGAPRGARLIHRPGYHAPRPLADRSDLEQRLAEAEELLGNRQRADFPVIVLASPFPAKPLPARAGSGAAGGASEGVFTRVPLLLQISGEELLAERQASADVSGIRVQVFALDDAGAIIDFLAQDLSFDPARVGERLRDQGVRIYGELAVPAGVYRLRLYVEELGTGRNHLATVPLVVREPAQGSGPALLPPLFPDLGEGWVLARASRAGETAARYPFTLAGREIVPDLRPTLAAGQPRALVLFTRNAPGTDPSLVARVRGPDGEVIAGGRLEVVQRLEDEADGLTRLVATFDPQDLAPGEYRLEVSLVEAGAGRTATRSTAFRVVEGGGS